MKAYEKKDNIYILFDNIPDKQTFGIISKKWKENGITITQTFMSDGDYCIEILVDRFFINFFVKKVAIKSSDAFRYFCIWKDFGTYGDYTYYIDEKNNHFYYDFENIGD